MPNASAPIATATTGGGPKGGVSSLQVSIGRKKTCDFSRQRGGGVLQGRSLERTLRTGDGRRREEGE